MTTPETSTGHETPTSPRKRIRFVWTVLALSLIALVAVVYSALSSSTSEQPTEASYVWVGNGWESTKIPTAELPNVQSEIDRYRVRLDTDPNYQEEDFYTDLFHANTLDAYRTMVDFHFDTTEFYEQGERLTADAELHIHSCDTLDAYLHLWYVTGSEPIPEDEIDEGEAEAGLWEGAVGGRASVDRVLHAMAIYGDGELQDVMDECGLNERQ